MAIQNKDNSIFSDLFILEMANNHQGSVEHGKRIIDEHGGVTKNMGVQAAVKLQFRNLDTFIHPDFRERDDVKHVQRFLSTRLSEDEFKALVEHTRARGLVTMSTPFDEDSVDTLVKLGVEILKIGSCSARDWPLLEKAAATGKPMIVSTGGLSIKDIDKLVSFLDHKDVQFALMHCIAIYPTPHDQLQLNQIDNLRARYHHVPIGFSTHEHPDNMSAVQIACAKGAKLFERHVGVATSEINLNAYSSTPQQLEQWIRAYKEAKESCGSDIRPAAAESEMASLKTLLRGVYVKKDIQAGEVIQDEDVFFSIPLQEGQLTSGEWSTGHIADRSYKKNDPVSSDALKGLKKTNAEIIYHSIHEIRGMLNIAKIHVGYDFDLELSHHYGLENFHEAGVAIITCINREYCKKILVQMAGQRNPSHHHKKKEESFQILWGELDVDIEGRVRRLYPGDTLLVQRGVRHGFSTETGVVFEEVSTTHYNNDSIYEDHSINNMKREDRKTKLVNWGRYQFE